VTANFAANPTSGQAPLTVQFTDQSSGPVTGWNWSFGDGSANSSAQNPSHVYNSAGSFTATLTVTGNSGQTSSKSQTITVANPPPPSTVTVVATQPLASLLAPGVFTITRSGSTASALTVNYSLGGSAVNGGNYATLSGSAVIPAGASATTVIIAPIGLLNILRTVDLTVSPESSYNVGSPDSATVTIVVSIGL
jgi:PKD repeat protein